MRKAAREKEVEGKEETVYESVFIHLVDHANVRFFFCVNSLHCFV